MTLSAQGDSVRVFEDADVYYASGLRTFPIWGAYGVALLRRLELLIRRRLTELGYAEIALPALCRLDALEAFVGDKKRHLFEVEDGRRPALALSPFSELQYIEHLQSRSTRPPYLARVFQWSRRYVREAGSGALDFGEYVKCEAFSVHNGARDAVAAGAVLAQAFRDFCVSDLALSPMFGERPRRTAFPGAEATWSAELPLPGGDLQTLIVSHRMHTSFFAANGFDMPSGARLNSACFSQKLLTAVLLHHRDSFGFRIPPALAPTLGVVMGGRSDSAGYAGLERMVEPDRIARLDGGDPLQEMVRRGAAWAIERVEPAKRRRPLWRLYSRRSPGSKPRAFDDIAHAIGAAAREADALARDMRKRSRARANELNVAPSRDHLTRASVAPEPVNVAAPCCHRASCEAALLGESAWIPKLLTAGTESRRCFVCDAPTRNLLVFEREERYTSFYRPAQPA